ncbi:MAG TPA: TetR/AcrR family transcriptional regulator [Acidimicrobiales bacterium]|nr:TetR/AcrR family transcriptional regulator [Acidimicrobiales bacterium]
MRATTGEGGEWATDRVPLLEEQRQLARDRIQAAAVEVLRDKGLAATVEEVAARAGVSMRTVFRHYGTRDHMVASALRVQLSRYVDSLPRPRVNGPLEDWLPSLLQTVHHLNAELGRAYWELAALGPTLEGELAEAAAQRRAGRTKLVAWAVSTAWRLAGQRGRPPKWLFDTFAIHLSAFATRSLVADFGQEPSEVAEASSRALLAAVDAARR